MAFKNLVQKFEANIHDLYGKYSNKDAPDTDRGNEPYIEVKPDNPNLVNYGEDKRSSPFHSIQTDFRRMTLWSTSNFGKYWYLDQQTLQAGNTFSETRVLNPTFVLGNTQPFVHVRRSISAASGLNIPGDTQDATPGADARIGGAGRLQIATAKHVTGLISTGGQRSLYQRILSWIPPVRAVSAIAGAINIVGNNGILGVNQRPEFDFGGTFYSIAVWEGFKASEGPVDNLERAASNFRQGNILGGVASLGRAVSNTLSDINQVGRDVVNLSTSIFGRRNNPVSNVVSGVLGEVADDTNKPAGWRYFITGKYTVDRYLEGTIDSTQSGPRASLSFLNKRPKVYNERVNVVRSNPSGFDAIDSTGDTGGSALEQRRNQFNNNVFRNLTRAAARIGLQALNSVGDQTLPFPLPERVLDIEGSENPAEEVMKFSGLAIRNRFNNEERFQYLKTTLGDQISRWKDSFDNGDPLLFAGGINPRTFDSDMMLNPKGNFKFPSIITDTLHRKKYFFDKLNSSNFTLLEDLSGNVSSETRANVQSEAPGLVDLYFYDVNNHIAIPFRAYLRTFNENITPQFADTMYIGRTERNVVYAGARRDCQIAFAVHAFNEEELTTIWKKINYLSSLCFPATYNNGFMVPPLVKLTLGDIYNNQPGYLKSLSNTIEDTTTWEITPERQVPHGIIITLQYSLIEKRTISSSDYVPGNNEREIPLYAYGRPRSEFASSVIAPTIDTSGGDPTGTGAPTNEPRVPGSLPSGFDGTTIDI